MQEIITSFIGKYGLSRAEVIVELENAFSTMLTRWYRLPVIVFFRNDLRLEAVAYNDTGGVVMQKPIDLAEMKGRKTILRYLEDSLAKAAVLKEIAVYKKFEREMRWGEIIGRDRQGNFLVEAEVVHGEMVIGVCPLNRIGIHERNSATFVTGRHRAFHLRRVEPVSINGTSRLKVVVDRVSKTLVENLLKEQLGTSINEMKIRCLKRYVGHKSLLVTSRRIPKKAIIAVDRELKERVEVRIVNP